MQQTAVGILKRDDLGSLFSAGGLCQCEKCAIEIGAAGLSIQTWREEQKEDLHDTVMCVDVIGMV